MSQVRSAWAGSHAPSRATSAGLGSGRRSMRPCRWQAHRVQKGRDLPAGVAHAPTIAEGPVVAGSARRTPARTRSMSARMGVRGRSGPPDFRAVRSMTRGSPFLAVESSWRSQVEAGFQVFAETSLQLAVRRYPGGPRRPARPAKEVCGDPDVEGVTRAHGVETPATAGSSGSRGTPPRAGSSPATRIRGVVRLRVDLAPQLAHLRITRGELALRLPR